ncbi:MAG: DcrB-related protein [Pseudomonadota bacterium]|nr:DcrB-related protein [Pseudomonadota bacterium]
MSGLAAEEIEFTWLSEGDQMAQRQVYIAHKGNVLVFTATMMETFIPEGHQYWETILAQFQFRAGMK